jgi:hypothetical protein
MVKVGDKKRFVPAAYARASAGIKEMLPRVTGVVDYVNIRHGWYRVAYETKYFGTQHECFRIIEGGINNAEN